MGAASRGCELVRGHADQLFRGIAKNTFDRRIDGRETPVEVQGRDDVVGIIDQIAIALLAFQKRRLDRLSFGDVHGRR